MAIDFEKIRLDNIRRHGEETDWLTILEKLYSDQTHFIYELLQNAEDVKATTVKFSLYPDSLEFEHNGRPFNEEDVRGICGIRRGTKTEDITLIGKFGIGFKSVYAITSNPEVHSGKDHFRIEHYVRPYDCEEKNPTKGHSTLFIFPFDREDVEAPMAFDELHESLKNMPTHTILFLKHIKKIHIMINGEDCLTLSKQFTANHSNGTSEVILTNGKFHKENYLLFSKPVLLSNADLSVEISYQLSKEGTPTRPSNTSLVVFFPTEKATNLGFLIQGPYRTTPARDNIPAKDDFNKQLIELTADLMVESLVWLRDHSYLNENTYDLLPLDETYFQPESMFRPFYDKLFQAFSSIKLLMTSTKNSTRFVYGFSHEIAIARSADLRQLMDNTMLNDLTKGDVKYWLNGAITEQTKPTLYKYLKERLGLKEWRPEDMVRKLDTDFISKRDDQWLIKLYKLIHSQRQWFKIIHGHKSQPKSDIEQIVPFLGKEIIRLQDGNHVKPYKDSTCLEPSAYISEYEVPGFPIVKNTLIEDIEIRQFFTSLSYTKPDKTENVIVHIIPTLTDTEDEELDEPKQLIDRASMIIEAWANGNNAQKKLISEKLKDKKWVPAYSFADSETILLAKADLCYIKNHETTMLLKGSEDYFYVCDELTGYSETLLQLGIYDKVKVLCRKPDNSGDVVVKNKHSDHVRGLRRFDPGADIEGLNHAIMSTFIKDLDIDRACFLWNVVLIPNKHLIKGEVQTSTRQTFENPSTEVKESKFGSLLFTVKQCIDKLREDKGLGKLSIDDLPDGFIKDKELADILGIDTSGTDILGDLARETGLPKEMFQEMKNNPELVAKILALYNQDRNKQSPHTQGDNNFPEFPNSQVQNPEQRAQSVSGGISGAPDKTYKDYTRSVRTSNKFVNNVAYLKNYYTNSDDDMVCQLCKKIMPFKKKNGDYYFEAVEIFPKKVICKENESLYIALCPTCSAKYKEYIKPDPDKIQALLSHFHSNENEEIPIETDISETLRFNPPHFLDIRTIVNTLSAIHGVSDGDGDGVC